MILEWTSALRVGVEQIDEQHQELFRRAERLVLALEAGHRADVDPLLRYLTDYVVSHFEFEERWMAEAEYPGLEAHRDAHRRFMDDLRERTREYRRQGPTRQVAASARGWLTAWFEHHIAGADVKLGHWLASRERHPPH